eukprot:scaffold267280_cov30-Tisochrysis_lutea.AAC.4
MDMLLDRRTRPLRMRCTTHCPCHRMLRTRSRISDRRAQHRHSTRPDIARRFLGKCHRASFGTMCTGCTHSPRGQSTECNSHGRVDTCPNHRRTVRHRRQKHRGPYCAEVDQRGKLDTH